MIPDLYFHGDLSISWKFLLAVCSIIVAFILYTMYKFVLRPLIRVRFYHNQGIPCFYFPILGIIWLSLQSFKKFGDSQYKMKTKARTNSSKASCSNFGSTAYVILHDPKMIKDFFQNQDNYIKDPMFLETYKLLLGNGLLTSEGIKWKSQRKIISNTFHFEFLKSILPNIQKIANNSLHTIRKRALKKVDIMEEFQKITGGVIGQMFFGEQLVKHESDEKPLTIVLADLLIDLGRLSLSADRFLLGLKVVQKGIFPKHKRLINKIISFKNICRQIIQERKKNYLSGDQTKDTKDLLDLLLKVSNEVEKMDDEEIIDQFITFFLAGMDTTGHLVTMAVYYLFKHQEYKAQMIEEIKKYYKTDSVLNIDELNKLEFTMAFLKETLRMMTPVPAIFLRKALNDHKIGDISIRKDDLVSVNFFYNQFNPEHFENPDKFNPNRWLTKEKANEAYVFIPFAAGPRNCIGQHLALIEARIILAEFLSMYDFDLQEEYRLRMSVKFLYEPFENILLNLTPKV